MDVRAAGRSDDGKTFTLPLGGGFAVELDENPTTGYVWAIDSMDEERVSLVRSDFRPGSGAIGAGGRRVFLFRAEAAGRARVSLKLWRQWIGDASVIDRCAFYLQITVESTAPQLETGCAIGKGRRPRDDTR